MRAVLQRVTAASVVIEGHATVSISQGLVVLLGVEQGDTEADAQYMITKIPQLRIFNDDQQKFNRSLLDVGGELLLVSQFTLHGDCRKGRRPSFIQAAAPADAVPLYERTIALLREQNITVKTGVFGAHMQVSLVNDGPVTLLLDSRKSF